MPAEIREKPILTGKDARRFIEREKQINNKRKEMTDSGIFPRIKKRVVLYTKI